MSYLVFQRMFCLHSHLPPVWMVRLVLQMRLVSMARQVELSAHATNGSKLVGRGGAES